LFVKRQELDDRQDLDTEEEKVKMGYAARPRKCSAGDNCGQT
jgi:hypothetical protein